MSTESTLIGYARKSNVGRAIKLNLNHKALMEAETVTGMDGVEYVPLIISLNKLMLIIRDEHEVTSVCQLSDDENGQEAGR